MNIELTTIQMKPSINILIAVFLLQTIITTAQITASFTVQPSTASCGIPFKFDASSSSPSQGHNIIKYEWDFDYDGSTFNVQDTGMIIYYTYSRMNVIGSGVDMNVIPYVVALRVTNNSNPPEIDTTTNNATLSFQNIRPVADAGGPYYSAIVNDTSVSVTLDGTRSYDSNSPCDDIAVYKWDTDSDGLYGSEDTDGSLCGSADCEGSVVTVKDENWRIGQTVQISLIVTDSYGLTSGPSETTIQIRDVATMPPTIHDVIIDDLVRGDAEFTFHVSNLSEDPITFDCEFFINSQQIYVYDTNDNLLTQINYDGGNVIQSYLGYFDATAFVDGKKAYRLKVVLKNKNSGATATKESLLFTIDNNPPTNPSECTDKGTTNGVCTSDNDPEFSWSGAHDNISDTLCYYYYWGTDPNGTSSTNTTMNGFDPEPLTNNGTYFLRINTYDQAGNEAGWTTLYTYMYFYFIHADTDTICENDSLLWHGNYYNNAGTYYDSLQTINGCDSVYELQLFTNPTYYYNEQYEICDNDSLLWHGSYYNIAGTYYDSLQTVDGCDSVFILNLFTNQKPLSFAVTGENSVTENQIKIYLVPDNPFVTYYWNVQNGNITNQIANGQAEIQWGTPNIGYVYVFAEDQNGCASDTAILEVTINITTGFKTLSKRLDNFIYPNPVKNIIYVKYNKEFSIEVYNIHGKKLITSKQSETEVSELKVGIYIILLKDRENNMIEISKFIKH